MRIITGKHKGRKLYTLEGMNTRPMMDRMKESVFNIIGPFFEGGIVLDLFGGSGALSLESISRGASFAYVVEKHPSAVNVIKKNIELVKEDDSFNIMQMDYKLALKYFKENNLKFDYIFLDPPFRLKVIDEIIKFILDNNLLNKHGYIVCQYLKDHHEPKSIDNLILIKDYNYGENLVSIYELT